jgi:hypothetical protein
VQCEVVRLTNGPEHGIKCVPVLLNLRPAGVSGIPHGLGAGQTGDDGEKDYLVGRQQVLVSAIIRMVPAPFDLTQHTPLVNLQNENDIDRFRIRIH